VVFGPSLIEDGAFDGSFEEVARERRECITPAASFIAPIRRTVEAGADDEDPWFALVQFTSDTIRRLQPPRRPVETGSGVEKQNRGSGYLAIL
jgi:hypothetical protein